jgi:hypothetical protein
VGATQQELETLERVHRTQVKVIPPQLVTATASRMSREELVGLVVKGSSISVPRTTLAVEVRYREEIQ